MITDWKRRGKEKGCMKGIPGSKQQIEIGTAKVVEIGSKIKYVSSDSHQVKRRHPD